MHEVEKLKKHNRLLGNFSIMLFSALCGIFGFGSSYFFSLSSQSRNFNDEIFNLLANTPSNTIIQNNNTTIATITEGQQKSITLNQLKNINSKDSVNKQFSYQELKFTGSSKANVLDDPKYCKVFDHTVKMQINNTAGTGWFFDFVLPQNGQYPTKWFLITAYHVVANQLNNLNNLKLIKEKKSTNNCLNSYSQNLNNQIETKEANLNLKAKIIYDANDFYGRFSLDVNNKKLSIKSTTNDNTANKNLIDYRYFKDLAVVSVEFNDTNQARELTNNIYEKYYSDDNTKKTLTQSINYFASFFTQQSPTFPQPSIVKTETETKKIQGLNIDTSKSIIEKIITSDFKYEDYIKNKLFIGGYPYLLHQIKEYKEIHDLWKKIPKNDQEELLSNLKIKNTRNIANDFLKKVEVKANLNNLNNETQAKNYSNFLNKIKEKIDIKNSIEKWLLSIHSFKNIDIENQHTLFTVNRMDKFYFPEDKNKQFNNNNLIDWNGIGSPLIGLPWNNDQYSIKNHKWNPIFIENIAGLVYSSQIENELGSCISPTQINSMLVCDGNDRLYRWGHYYAVNNVGLIDGASGSMTLNSEGEVIGVYVAYNSENNIGFIEPLRSPEIRDGQNIVSPAYDLIHGTKFQTRSYKSEILKDLSSSGDKTWLSTKNSWN